MLFLHARPTGSLWMGPQAWQGAPVGGCPPLRPQLHSLCFTAVCLAIRSLSWQRLCKSWIKCRGSWYKVITLVAMRANIGYSRSLTSLHLTYEAEHMQKCFALVPRTVRLRKGPALVGRQHRQVHALGNSSHRCQHLCENRPQQQLAEVIHARATCGTGSLLMPARTHAMTFPVHLGPFPAAPSLSLKSVVLRRLPLCTMCWQLERCLIGPEGLCWLSLNALARCALQLH